MDVRRHFPVIRRARAGLVAISVLILVAACSSQSGDPEADSVEGSPLLAAFGIPDLDREVDLEREVQEAVRVRANELTAVCMLERGFDFEPFPPPKPQPDLSAMAPIVGFGVVAAHLGELEQLGFDLEPEAPTIERTEDPGDVAYLLALFGEEPTADPEATDESPSPTRMGCFPQAQSRASLEVRDKYVTDLDAVDQANEALQEVFRRLESDDRITGSYTSWSHCMAEEGFSGLVSEANAILGVENDLNRLLADRASTDEIRRLQQDEIRVAVASDSCNQQSKRRFREVQWEYEREYLRETGADS